MDEKLIGIIIGTSVAVIYFTIYLISKAIKKLIAKKKYEKLLNG